MIGVSDGPDGNIPGGLPREAFFIHEDAHQLGDDQSRMGIVDVDGNVLIETIETFSVFFLIMADNTLDAGRYEEVFLHQAQARRLGAVIGIEETGNLLDAVFVAEGPVPVTH